MSGQVELGHSNMHSWQLNYNCHVERALQFSCQNAVKGLLSRRIFCTPLSRRAAPRPPSPHRLAVAGTGSEAIHGRLPLALGAVLGVYAGDDPVVQALALPLVRPLLKAPDVHDNIRGAEMLGALFCATRDGGLWVVGEGEGGGATRRAWGARRGWRAGAKGWRGQGAP